MNFLEIAKTRGTHIADILARIAKTPNSSDELFNLLKARGVNVSDFKLAVQAGADIHYICPDSNESVLYAALQTDPEIAEYVIDNIHNITDSLVNGPEGVLFSVYYRMPNTELTIKAIDKTHELTGFMLVDIATKNPEAVPHLLDRINNKNEEGSLNLTMLSVAVAKDDRTLIKHLINSDTDVNYQNINGKAAAHYATSFEMLELLESYGADLSVVDNEGNSVFKNIKKEITNEKES